MSFKSVWLIVLVLAFGTPGFSQASPVQSSSDIAIDQEFLEPCNGSEMIHATGYLHEVATTVSDNKGVAHTLLHFNDQSLIGVGETSGIQYVIVESENWTVNSKSLPSEFTVITASNLISQSSTTNSYVHISMHLTVDANGIVTALFNDFTASCK